LASNSSRNSVRAECTGAYADGPTKQIVVILYGNGTASRPSRSLAAVREGAGADRLTDLDQLVEVALGAVTVDDAAHDPLQPGAAFAARHTLPARLVCVEPSEGERRRRDVSGLVHHHHRARIRASNQLR
jgi:hypothetical protein